MPNLSNWFYGTGRRKSSIARVWIHPGEGKVVINDMPMSDYLTRRVLEQIVRQPLGCSKRFRQF